MEELTYKIKYRTHGKDDMLWINSIRVKREFTMDVPDFSTICDVIEALKNSHDELVIECVELCELSEDEDNKTPTKRFKFKNP